MNQCVYAVLLVALLLVAPVVVQPSTSSFHAVTLADSPMHTIDARSLMFAPLLVDESATLSELLREVVNGVLGAALLTLSVTTLCLLGRRRVER